MNAPPLHIGIDARTVCHPSTGDRTYALGLLHGLAALRREGAIAHEFVVYLDHEPPADLPFMTPDGIETGWQVRVLQAAHERLWALAALPAAVRADRLDVLHVQYNGPRVGRCALVTTVHDVSFRLRPEWFPVRDRLLLDWGLRSTLRAASAVLTGSQCTCADLQEIYGLPPERITVTPYALLPGFAPPAEHEAAAIRAQYRLPERYLLFVGVRQPRKNLPRTIRAFLAARRDHSLPHRLAVVGKTGWCADETERTLAEAGEAVIAPGYVPDDHLPALYAGADAFLFPSLYEGFGLPVLEAFACGTPVITSAVSSLPEVAGDAALLVDPTSEEEIARAIGRVIADAELRARLITAGRERLVRFDWRRTAEQTVAAYERAVSRQ